MSQKKRSSQQSKPLAQTPVRAPVPAFANPSLLSAPSDRAQQLSISSQQQVAVSFSGPLPHPDILRAYDEIEPGTAAKIIAQAAKQTEHRTALESKVIDADIKKSHWGLVAGFVISMTCVIGGVALVFAGHDAAGTTIATASVVGLATVFVYGTATRKKEREEKAKIMAGVQHAQASNANAPPIRIPAEPASK
jgi:uncharacterized membrane protein